MALVNIHINPVEGSMRMGIWIGWSSFYFAERTFPKKTSSTSLGLIAGTLCTAAARGPMSALAICAGPKGVGSLALDGVGAKLRCRQAREGPERRGNGLSVWYACTHV